MSAFAHSLSDADLSEPLLDANHIHGNRKRGIAGQIPMSASTFWARVSSGEFPSGAKYGSRRYWTSGQVRQMKRLIMSGTSA